MTAVCRENSCPRCRDANALAVAVEAERHTGRRPFAGHILKKKRGSKSRRHRMRICAGPRVRIVNAGNVNASRNRAGPYLHRAPIGSAAQRRRGPLQQAATTFISAFDCARLVRRAAASATDNARRNHSRRRRRAEVGDHDVAEAPHLLPAEGDRARRAHLTRSSRCRYATR